MDEGTALELAGIFLEEPLTEELLAELLEEPSVDRFVEQLPASVPLLHEYLAELLETKGLKRSSVVRMAGLNETFGYQIFTGHRHASRNNLLKIAFAMGLNLYQTARLLQAGGAASLYCKNRRDAIIIFALNNGYSLQRTEEELYRFGEETIC